MSDSTAGIPDGASADHDSAMSTSRLIVDASAGAPASAARAPGPPPDRSPMHVECVTTVDGLAGLEREWDCLFRRVPGALPFASHAWAAAWWTHLRRTSGRWRDALRVYTIRDASGAAVAFAPYMSTSFTVAGLPLVRILQPIGADPNLTEVRGILVRPELEAPAVAALVAHVEREGGFAWCTVGGLRGDGDAIAALRRRARTAPGREVPAFTLRLPETWAEFRGSRPRNVRESLRKCYNSLARDGHEWQFRTLDDGAEVSATLWRFFDLHTRRADSDAGASHPDYFAAPAARAFLTDVVARFGRAGAVRMFQLEIAGEVVAMRLGFQTADMLYLYYSGYDPAWARYSVMTTVVAEAIQHAIARGIPSVHLSTGADVSKTRWRPEVTVHADTVVAGAGVRARLARRAFTTTRETLLALEERRAARTGGARA